MINDTSNNIKYWYTGTGGSSAGSIFVSTRSIFVSTTPAGEENTVMNVFEYIIVYVGIMVQNPDGTFDKNKGAEIIGSGHIVAKNAERARSIVSATKIPASWHDRIDNIQVMVQDRGALQ